jgi:hypothetical protein
MSGSAGYTVMQFMSARTGNAPLPPLISSANLSPPVVLPAQPASQSPSR